MSGRSEADLVSRLVGLGYEKTRYESQTGDYWVNLTTQRHLLVPRAADGWYPSWMIEELVERAEHVGDHAAAGAINSLLADRD